MYEKNVFISLFLGITIGPIIVELVEAFSGAAREKVKRGFMRVRLEKIKSIPINPLKHLTREELGHAVGWASVTSVLAMVMSPVGLTILIGDLIKGVKRRLLEASILAYTVRDAIKNATYIGGTLIPLLVIHQPTGPMSAGPALPFFTEIEALGGRPVDYLIENYGLGLIAVTVLASITVASLIAYPLLIKYSRAITLFVFRRIPAESLYGLFIAIVLVLAYNDAGVPGLFGVLVVSLISGVLWRLGVSLGVLFMTLVAAPIIVGFLKAL